VGEREREGWERGREGEREGWERGREGERDRKGERDGMKGEGGMGSQWDDSDC